MRPSNVPENAAAHVPRIAPITRVPRVLWLFPSIGADTAVSSTTVPQSLRPKHASWDARASSSGTGSSWTVTSLAPPVPLRASSRSKSVAHGCVVLPMTWTRLNVPSSPTLIN